MHSRDMWMTSICSCPRNSDTTANRPPDCKCPDPPCHFCGEPLLYDGDLEVHHLDHNSNHNVLDNLVGAHVGCHRSHHAGGDAVEPQSERIIRRFFRLVFYSFKTQDMPPSEFAEIVEEVVMGAAAYAQVPPEKILQHPVVAEAIECYESIRRPRDAS